MPTGYTSDIYEGKPISPREFLSKFARNYGLYFHLRETSMDEGLLPPTQDTYYETWLGEAEDELSWFKYLKKDSDEASRRYEEERRRHDDARREEAKRRVKMRRRYDKMIEAVESLEIPEDTGEDTFFHNYITGAIQHLEESRKFDAGDFNRPKWVELYPTVDSWLDCSIDSAESRIARYREQIENDKARYEQRLAAHNRLVEFLDGVDNTPVV